MNELQGDMPQMEPNSVKIQTQTPPTASDALGLGKQLLRRDSPSWFDSRGLCLLALQRIDMLLLCLQKEGSSMRAQTWRDHFSKPISGRFRISQDCCGTGARVHGHWVKVWGYFSLPTMRQENILKAECSYWIKKRKHQWWWGKTPMVMLWGSGHRKGRKAKTLLKTGWGNIGWPCPYCSGPGQQAHSKGNEKAPYNFLPLSNVSIWEPLLHKLWSGEASLYGRQFTSTQEISGIIGAGHLKT